MLSYAQNPLDPFSRSSPVDGYGMLPTWYRLATGKLWGNWCNGFWPL